MLIIYYSSAHWPTVIGKKLYFTFSEALKSFVTGEVEINGSLMWLHIPF